MSKETQLVKELFGPYANGLMQQIAMEDLWAIAKDTSNSKETRLLALETIKSLIEEGKQ